MKGNPKYKVGDKVVIELQGQKHVGEVYLIDKYGTLEDSSDVSYDVLIHDYIHPNGGGKVSDCVCKHYTEKIVEPYVAD